MKNHATETDIITIPDPIFFIGDIVDWSEWTRGSELGYQQFVESVCWSEKDHSWAYTLVYFHGTPGNLDDGRHMTAYALEKDLVLLKRAQPKISGKYAIVNGKKFIF